MTDRQLIFWNVSLTNRMFGLRYELVHHRLTPYIFVCLVEWIGLIHHHLISHKLIISISVGNRTVPLNLKIDS
jgi:hypothetical protein